MAEMVGFEPTEPVKVQLISSQHRYDHFDTSPYRVSLVYIYNKKRDLEDKTYYNIFHNSLLLSSQLLIILRFLYKTILQAYHFIFVLNIFYYTLKNMIIQYLASNLSH